MNPWLVGVRNPLGWGCGAGLVARRMGSSERLAARLVRAGVTDSKGLEAGTAEARGVT